MTAGEDRTAADAERSGGSAAPEGGVEVRGRTRPRRRERVPIRDRPPGGSEGHVIPDGRRPPPLRILVLDPSGERAGYCHDLCNALTEDGSTVHLLTTEGGHSSIQRCGTHRYRFRTAFGRSGTWSAGAAVDGGPGGLWRRVRRSAGRAGALLGQLSVARRYDVVHWQGPPPGLAEALWFRALRRRATVVCTAHGVLDDSGASRLRERVRGIGYRACDVVVAHTAEGVHRLREHGVPGERIVLIRRGSSSHLMDGDILEPPGSSPRGDRPVVLYLGSVSKTRGVDVLLRAVNHLRRYVWDFRVVVAGSPTDDPSSFEDLVRDLGVESHVELRFGALRDAEIGGYLQQATVLALPYRAPGDGAAAASACTFGKPVVASRVPGLKELVEESGNGVLVRPEDPAALGAALADVLRDGELRRRCETNSLIYARTDLSWQRIAEETRAAYRGARPVAG